MTLTLTGGKKSFQAVLERLSSIKHPKFSFVGAADSSDPLLTWWSTGKRVHVHLEDNEDEWSAWTLDRSKGGVGFQDWKLPANPEEAEKLVRELLDSFDGVLDRIVKETEEIE